MYTLSCSHIIFVTQLKDVKDVSALRQLLFDAADTVIDCGYSKPLTSANLVDIEEISDKVALHRTLLVSLAEIDQLISGLNVLGVADLIKEYPHLFLSFFTSEHRKKLTAGVHKVRI